MQNPDYRHLLEQALQQLRAQHAEIETLKQAKTEPIAVIGLGCRFPGGVETPEQFWELLATGVDTITEVPPQRWDLATYYDANPDAVGKMYTRYGAFLDKIEEFDAHFFGIAPREALSLDPQQRLLLEVSWEALEHAGLNPHALNGSNTGVFIGVFMTDYALSSFYNGQPRTIDAYSGLGTLRSMAAGRLAYVYNFQGPTLQLDTACSSSLLATHLACQSLRAGECHLALVGGVNLILIPENSISLSKMKALSADGRCKAFAATADGYGRGEGCGIAVLKRLADAQRDGDTVLAVIFGSAVNHDGRSNGLTAPNGLAQEQVLKAALAQAQLDPAQIQYVETHGTGTILGDPIEISALTHVLGKGHTKTYNPLYIGSVKTNVGHLEAAAGIVALIKVVLSLQHAKIPAHLHFTTPSPHIPWEKIPLAVPTQLSDWPAQTQGRLAGISSFGMSGTNVHLILGETPRISSEKGGTPSSRYEMPFNQGEVNRVHYLLTLSARNEEALRALAHRYHTFLTQAQLPTLLPSLCYTAHCGRAVFDHRVALVTDSTETLAAQLEAFSQQQPHPGVLTHPPLGHAPLAFLFSGQGAQYMGMGQILYQTCAQFRQVLDECEELLKPHLRESLLSLIYSTSREELLLNQTIYTQPALFAIEYALAKTLQAFGIKPDFVMGHSVGEYVAASIAGVFSLADGLKLIAARGRLMQTLCETGAMLVTPLSEAEANTLIAPHAHTVAIAALNGPANTVLSGTHTTLAQIARYLTEKGIKTKALTVSHAFHSPLMEPMLAEFEQIAHTITYHPPQIPLLSNVTGERIHALTPAYWSQHIRQTVRFADSITTLYVQGCRLFLEVGPKPVLLNMAQTCLSPPSQAGIGDCLWLPTLRAGKNDWQILLYSLGQLYLQGRNIDWPTFYQGAPQRKIALPTYPFQRQYYWIERKSFHSIPSAHPLIGEPLTVATTHDHCFTTQLGRHHPAFLAHHQINHEVIVPAALYIELCLAAVKHRLKEQPFVLNALTFERPLALPETELITVQVILTPADSTTYTVGIYSLDDTTWTRHASGQATITDTALADVWTWECPNSLDLNAHYLTCAQQGLHYGEQFQTLRQLRQGTEQAWGQLQLADEMGIDTYLIHPTLLDGCLQMAMALIPENYKQNTYLPFAIEQIKFKHPATPALQCTARLHLNPENTQTFAISLQLTDLNGQIVAEFNKISYKQLTTPTLTYQLTWQAHTWTPIPTAQTPGTWLILAEPNGIGLEFSQLISAHGDHCTFASRIEASLVRTVSKGIIYLLPDSTAEPLSAAVTHCLALVQLIQALPTASKPPRLWIITRWASPPFPIGTESTLAAATLWGLGRTIQLEYPDVECVLLDRDDATTADSLFQELWTPSAETQQVWRQNDRYVARLEPFLPKKFEAFQVVTTAAGTLEALDFKPQTRRSPRADEVEVRVHATALNFRDVLNALGMLPAASADTVFGFEAAGIITACGDNVTEFQVGDEVICALVTGGLCRYLYVSPQHLLLKPVTLSFAEASTIPLVFLTSLYALIHLAKLQPGERVLIHAASGGVGLSALQIAKRCGAEIYATASPGKWSHLQTLGIKHIYNSRTLDFGPHILHDTQGQGVDVILNSLGGEFITESFKLLRPGGRFVEIGEVGRWDETLLQGQERNGFTYFSFDLKEILKRQSAIIFNLLKELEHLFLQGELAPLLHRDFPLEHTVEAFRFLAQTKHVGKVVITQAPAELCRPQASYLITGGFGTLGLASAQWLARHGARCLILFGRNEPKAHAQALIQQLRHEGVQVHIHLGDVADADDVAHLFKQLHENCPPLRGIFHTAGVLDDATLSQLTPAHVARVLAAKVAGSWHLHTGSVHLPLDYFLLFSSAAGLLGATGQGNYAAANAYLDALAHYRQAQQLPALSINWGLWKDSPMATPEICQRLATQGVQTLTFAQGLKQLEELLLTSATQVAVLPLNWPLYLARLPKIPPLLQRFKDKSPPLPRPKITFREEIAQTPLDKQPALIIKFVQTQIANVLGLESPQRVTPHQGFTDLGMDSLTAVELRNLLQTQLGCPLPATLAFDYPTLEALAKFILQTVSPSEPADTGVPTPTDLTALLADVEHLSDQAIFQRLRSGL